MTPSAAAVIEAAAAYSQSSRTLDDLRNQKAVLSSQLGDIATHIDATVVIVQADRKALKDAAGAL